TEEPDMRRALNSALPVLAFVALAAACSGPTDAERGAALNSDAATREASVTQIMSAAKLDTVKRALPKVAFPKLQDILNSPATMWYDKDVMEGCYQDSVGDIGYTPVGARRNNEGKALIVPEGKKMFTPDGATWSYPFGHTAGLDDSDNTVIV